MFPLNRHVLLLALVLLAGLPLLSFSQIQPIPDSLFDADLIIEAEPFAMTGILTAEPGTEMQVLILKNKRIWKNGKHKEEYWLPTYWWLSNLSCPDMDSLPMQCLGLEPGQPGLFFLNDENLGLNPSESSRPVFFPLTPRVYQQVVRWAGYRKMEPQVLAPGPAPCVYCQQVFESGQGYVVPMGPTQVMLPDVPSFWVEDYLDAKPLFDPEAGESCKLCEAVAVEDWKKVEKELKKVVRKHKSSRPKDESSNEGEVVAWLNEQPCVSWVIPPMAILSSLPTYYTMTIEFQARDRIFPMQMSLQLGRMKGRKGELDYLKYLGLSPDTLNSTDLLLGVVRSNWLNTVQDTLDSERFPAALVPPKTAFLPAYLEGGANSRFLNCNHFPEERWMESLEYFREKGWVHHLLLANTHCSQEVRLAALEHLEELNATEAVPYLLALVAHNRKLRVKKTPDAIVFGQYCKRLSMLLDQLTGAEVTKFDEGRSGQELLGLGQEIWQERWDKR